MSGTFGKKAQRLTQAQEIPKHTLPTKYYPTLLPKHGLLRFDCVPGPGYGGCPTPFTCQPCSRISIVAVLSPWLPMALAEPARPARPGPLARGRYRLGRFGERSVGTPLAGRWGCGLRTTPSTVNGIKVTESLPEQARQTFFVLT